MLHLRCGHDIRSSLRDAELPGEFVVWADPVCQGPAPAGLAVADWRRVRAAFIARAYVVPLTEALGRLEEEDAALERLDEHDEVVLWFEHDLFDQSILIHLLDRLARHRSRARLSLVSIGAHPEVERFVGLGQLSGAQLAALFRQRRPVTEAILALGQRAWKLYTADDPNPLAAFCRANYDALPFLSSALRRHLAELPDVRTGLGATERLALAGLAEHPRTTTELFRWVNGQEEAPWLGDTMFYPIVRELLDGCRRLIADGRNWPGQEEIAGAELRITGDGSDVLSGRADQVRLNGVDRWVGGVHLAGRFARWRWDGERGEVVAGR